jgi:hypothetical protein
MDDHDKVELILEWASHNSSFDPEFVISCQHRLERYGRLTERQNEALDDIMDQFGIE